MKRRWTIVLLVLSLLLGGTSAFALTPAQKRAKAKAQMERKREAQRRKAKKQRIKEGKLLLYVYTTDLRSGEDLHAAHVVVQDSNARPGKKPKINKPTDNKHARVSRTLPEGQYWATASRIGYFASDTLFFEHRNDEDTVRLSLYPETRLTFTVTDSLTSRPVVANIFVRNPEGEKVMQTTSDSLHALIAVLLDDRLPYYTIEATAVNYFPFRDTLTFPLDFPGVVMNPKEIKSFVLHKIYFATGKTRILDSSEPALNELYTFLASRPNQRIRIVGHTDNIGSERSNQLLSEGRCKEVRRVMISRGILPERIEIEGRGETDPIVPNNSEENRQMNRRVEIVLL
jgi:outer membrane protein OmpA-like peptidoglycan-associated protein